jgi:hypothetical protein
MRHNRGVLGHADAVHVQRSELTLIEQESEIQVQTFQISEERKDQAF